MTNFRLLFEKGFNNKVLLLLLGLIFLISKYVYLFSSKTALDKSDVIGFVAAGFAFLIYVILKSITNFSFSQKELKKSLKSLILIQAVIMIPFLLFGVLKMNFDGTFIAVLIFFNFIIIFPFLIRIYFTYVEEELFQAIGPGVSEDERKKIHSSYTWVIFFITITGIGIGWLFSDHY